MRELTLTALPGIPEVAAGTDLAALMLEALTRAGKRLQDGDVLVVAQKIVSKSEGRSVRLADVAPSARAQELAQRAERDPRLVELILRESREVLRVKPGVLIVEHRLGFVMASAGIDQSNVPAEEESALLLPVDPDASARRIREDLARRTSADVGIVDQRQLRPRVAQRRDGRRHRGGGHTRARRSARIAGPRRPRAEGDPGRGGGRDCVGRIAPDGTGGRGTARGARARDFRTRAARAPLPSWCATARRGPLPVIVALAGGVGGGRMAAGLAAVLPPRDLDDRREYG